MQMLCLVDIWSETFCPTGLEDEEDDESGTELLSAGACLKGSWTILPNYM